MEGTVTAAWRLVVGFLCERGMVREKNEDAFALYVPAPGAKRQAVGDAFFAVADGMGGHAAGEVASRHAVDAVESAFGEAEVTEDAADLPAWMDRLFQRINRELRAIASERALSRGMGTTLTLAVLRGETLTIGHVGDTRCYVARNGTLEQLTEDHSWVAEQRRAGLLSAEEERVHVNRNLLTQCLGIDADLDVFVHEETVREGDRYFLCSDGLHGQVGPAVMARVIAEEDDPQAAARRLVDLGNEAGGPDNLTAVLIYVERAPVRVPTLAEPAPAELAAIAAGTSTVSSAPWAGDGPPVAAKRRRPARALVLAGVIALLVAAGVGSWALLRERAPVAAEKTGADEGQAAGASSGSGATKPTEAGGGGAAQGTQPPSGADTGARAATAGGGGAAGSPGDSAVAGGEEQAGGGGGDSLAGQPAAGADSVAPADSAAAGEAGPAGERDSARAADSAAAAPAPPAAGAGQAAPAPPPADRQPVAPAPPRRRRAAPSPAPAAPRAAPAPAPAGPAQETPAPPGAAQADSVGGPAPRAQESPNR